MSTDTAATLRTLATLAAAVLLASLLLPPPAAAQFGYPGVLNLPDNDFTWTWGRPRANNQGREDFSVVGSDAGFRCDLRGRLRSGSTGMVSRFDMRALENQIRDQMRFISAATNKMNELEAQGALQWATLQCAKPKREE